MNPKKEMVETEVDILLRLLEKGGRISFEKAAKSLNVPLSTLEEWANFLEEEDMVTIKYSFTTPFLELRKEKKEEPEVKEKTKIKVKHPFGDILKRKPPEEKQKVIEKHKEGHFEIKESSNVDSLIQEAEQAINSNDFKKARFLYQKIKSLAKDLPFRFLEESQDIEKKLIGLSGDLSEHLDEFSIQTTERRIHEIKSLIKQTKKILKTDIHEAFTFYNKIKKLFSKLPKGFFEEKTLLEEEILELYKELLHNKKTHSSKEFHDKSKRVSSMINSIMSLLSSNNNEEALQLYDRLKKEVDLLPEGFLPQKLLLQQRVIDVYKEVLTSESKDSYKELSLKSIELTELLKKLDEKIESKEVEEAEIIYDQIRKAYSELPKGFIEEEIDLENSIIRKYDKLIKLKKNYLLKDEGKKIKEINYLLKIANKDIKNKKIEAAHHIYNEMILIYNSLPRGFSKRKLDLRKDILGLYGKVVANMDAIHLEKLDKNSKLDYNGLIKLLVRSYTDIEHKDFKQLKENYSHVYNLYNKLPIGFVKGNVKLKDEITKFHKLIKLLDVTNKLYELDNQNQKRELNNALRYILDNYIRLLDQAPEAQKLLDYVKMKYDKFQDNLRLATISSPEMSEFEKEIDETEHKLARSKKLLSEASQVRSRVGEAEELKKEIKARIQQLTQKQLERNKERLNLKNQIQNEKSFLKDYSRQKSAFEEPQQFQLHNEAQIHKESLPKPKLMLEPPKAVSREPIKETEETRRFREKLLKRRNELEKPTQVKQGPNLVEHYVQEEREKIEELKGLLGKKRKTLQEKRELLLKKNKIKSRIKELKIITEKQELAKRYFSHRRTYSIKKDVDKIYQDGLNHLERRNYTNAIICFKKILSAKPDHINAMIKLEEAEDKKKNEKGFPLKDRLVELKMRKIKANIGNEKNDILMNEVNEVLKLDPQNKEAQELLRKIIIEG